MKKYDCVIIGSGISGLSFAHYLARDGKKVLVLESENRVGGCFHSHNFGKKGNEFWLELGVHTCYNSYGNFLKIVEECKAMDLMIPRLKLPFRLLVNNEIKPIPSQVNKLPMIPGIVKYMLFKKDGKSVESFYSSIVGKENYKKLFFHVFNAVPSQDASGIPADMLFKKRKRRKDVLKKYTFKNGMQTVTDMIASQKNIDVKTKKEVMSITNQKGKYQILTKDKNKFETENLVLAVPPSVAAKLTKKVNSELSNTLAEIRETKVETIGVQVAKESLGLEPIASLIPLEDNFYSVVSRDIVEDEKFRGFAFHLSPGFLKKKEKIEKVSSVLGIESKQLKGTVEKVTILPSPVLGHHRITERIDSLLLNKNLFITGNYFFGMAVEDCVNRSLDEYTRMTLK